MLPLFLCYVAQISCIWRRQLLSLGILWSRVNKLSSKNPHIHRILLVLILSKAVLVKQVLFVARLLRRRPHLFERLLGVLLVSVGPHFVMVDLIILLRSILRRLGLNDIVIHSLVAVPLAEPRRHLVVLRQVQVLFSFERLADFAGGRRLLVRFVCLFSASSPVAHFQKFF